MTERRGADPWLATWTGAAVAAGAVAAPGLPALNGQPPDLAAFALHQGAAVALVLAHTLAAWRAGWLRRGGAGGHALWQVMLVGGVAVLGSAGAVACLVGVAAQRLFQRHSRPFQEWYHELFPEEHRGLAERLHDDLARTARRRSQDAEVVPFVDVIRHGKPAQKRIAIGLMSRHFRPEFAGALRLAVSDSDNSVRIQAATAIANVENQFLERMMGLRQQLGARANRSLLLELARQYDRYAFCGLLDEDREQRNREAAREFYLRYLELEPDDLDVRVAYGRLLLKLGRREEAREWLASTRARHGGTPRLDSWYMQALYELRDFAALREVARQVAETLPEEMPAVFRETVDLWAGTAR